jgi:hypothetical protein
MQNISFEIYHLLNKQLQPVWRRGWGWLWYSYTYTQEAIRAKHR